MKCVAFEPNANGPVTTDRGARHGMKGLEN